MENLEKIKILIVEDDLLIAENLKEILQDFWGLFPNLAIQRRGI